MTRQTSYEAGRDLVTRLAYAHPGATDALAQVSYAYDPLGRPTERQSRTGETAVLTHAYTYNSRSELTGETLSEGSVDTSVSAYAYDNIGNRTSAEEGSASAPTTYTANALNQYTGIQEGGATAAFAPTYNADGGMTKLCTATGIWNVTWNAENRPIKWVNPSAKTTIECAYDFMGRRCMKKVTQNGTVASHRLYLYRGYLLIAELDALNTVDTATEEGAATAPVVRKTWLWDPSEPTPTRRLAMTDFAAAGTPVETLYYAHELLKNTIALFDGEGNERARYDYAAFGQTLATSGPAVETNPYRYSGEYADDELGLIYYNYRHYDPQTGRWISRDPIGENGGVNLYGFVRNSPQFSIDVLGLTRGVNIRTDKESCTITISLNLAIVNSVRGLKIDIEKEIIYMKQEIEKVWGSGFYQYTKGCCSITVDVTTQVFSETEKIPSDFFPITLRSDMEKNASRINYDSGEPVNGEFNYDQIRRQKGNVNINGKYPDLPQIYPYSFTYAHEAGHIMGLPDEYYGPYIKPGREYDLMAKSDVTYNKPIQNLDEAYATPNVRTDYFEKIQENAKCPCGSDQTVRVNI